MGRKVRGHERPARLGAGRGLGGLFEPIPAGAGGGSSAGSSHDVSTGLDSAMSHHCTRGASDGVESRGGAPEKKRGREEEEVGAATSTALDASATAEERSREREGQPHAGTPMGSSRTARAEGFPSACRSCQRRQSRRKRSVR